MVAAEPAIDCTAAAYSRWRVALILLTVVDVLGLPIAILLLLVWNQRHLRTAHCEASSVFALRCGILFQAFRKSAFWWQCLILLRRCLLAVISVVHLASLRYLLFTLCTFALFLVHVLLRPYRSRQLNRVESVALALHVVMAAIMASVSDPPQGASLPVQVVLFLLIVLPVCVLALLLAFQRWSRKNKDVQRAVQLQELLLSDQ